MRSGRPVIPPVDSSVEEKPSPASALLSRRRRPRGWCLRRRAALVQATPRLPPAPRRAKATRTTERGTAPATLRTTYAEYVSKFCRRPHQQTPVRLRGPRHDRPPHASQTWNMTFAFYHSLITQPTIGVSRDRPSVPTGFAKIVGVPHGVAVARGRCSAALRFDTVDGMVGWPSPTSSPCMRVVPARAWAPVVRNTCSPRPQPSAQLYQRRPLRAQPHRHDR